MAFGGDAVAALGTAIETCASWPWRFPRWFAIQAGRRLTLTLPGMDPPNMLLP